MKVTLVFLAIILLSSFLTVASRQSQAQQSTFSDWTSPAYDSGNTNYNPQETISASNVQSLQVRWIYQVPVNPYNIPGSAPALGIETTPLVVDGVIYFATPYNRVIALVASSGNLLWDYQVNMSKFAGDSWWSRAYIISSLSYDNGTIYMMASDTSVYALNALNGKVEFVIPDTGANIPGNTGTYYGEKAPVIYRNLLIVRASTTDYGGRGYVAAYDLVTKSLAWRFYSVPPAGGDPSWDSNSSLGNIVAYPGDWGTSNLIGGGAAWGLMTIDNQSGILYFSTGHPSGLYDASLRQGPDLYTDSVIALNATNGRMVWYYQINPHDLAEHEGGWSITLSTITINGQQKKVLIQAAKNNYVYVLDARTGKPTYPPVLIGSPASNSPNDNGGPSVNLTGSQESMLGNRVCPGPDGGVEMSPALEGNTLFVVSQNACGIVYRGPITYKGVTFNGYVYTGDPTAEQNSTLYSIDLSTGTFNWQFSMPDRYQGSSAVVSGGVVYVVDRQGLLYMINERTGQMIRSVNLGGLGAAGVSLGIDAQGNMMLFVPAGGGDIPTSTPGVVLGLYLGSSQGQPEFNGFQILQEAGTVIFGVATLVLGFYVLLLRNARKSRPKAVIQS